MGFQHFRLRFKVWFFLLIFVLLTADGFAAHPLVTDDTGTQGKGKFQLEITSEFTYDKEAETKQTGTEVSAALSAGITDSTDIVLSLPYAWSKTEESGVETSDENGISDISLELKWRFYEKDGLSFALKPGLTLPTGDENKGLGNGRASYALVFITTKEAEPWAFHLNLGYTHNEYKLQADKDANRKDIWHASAAVEVETARNLKAVGNIGVERNPDKSSNTHPAFVLGGLIYCISENLDIDFGLKAGLNKPETDFTALLGVALRF